MAKQAYEPGFPGYEAAVRASFARQQIMGTLGAELASVEPGRVVIDLPFSEKVTQQHGTVHAGALATILDSACGYAALTLMPPGSGLVSVEFKVNLLRPARGGRGGRIKATAHVVKAGRTISVCDASAVEILGDDERLVATMTGTMMRVTDREGVVG